MHRILLFVVASLLAFPGLLAAQSEEDAVRAVVDGLFDAMRAGDSTGVRTSFHPRARMATVMDRGDEVALQIEESLDGFVTAVGTPHDEVWDERIWDVEVEVDGRLAAVWAPYAFYVGENFSHCGVDVFQLFKDPECGWVIFEIADTRRSEGCEEPGGARP